MRRILKWIALAVGVVVLAVAGFVATQVYAFGSSMAKVYDVPPMDQIVRSAEPAELARGKHMVESVGGCAAGDCHGPDLAGGKSIVMGPLGTVTGPNITAGGRGARYSDGELARLILHGIKRDGRSVLFMPSHEISWWPDEDLRATVSYLRTVPAVARADGEMKIGLLGKVLDRRDAVVLDVARRIDHVQRPRAPAPAPTAAYGAFLGRSCFGCHGEHLSGGRIPGAPSSLPLPLNLTPHQTGLQGWTFEDFDRLLTQGIRKNGKQLDPFMPVDSFSKLNEVEKRALWAFLQTLPPTPLGGR